MLFAVSADRIVAEAVVGSGLGGLAARLFDRGFSSDSLRRTGERLAAGQAAVVTVTTGDLADRVTESLKVYQQLFRQPLDPHLVAAAAEPDRATP